MRLSPRAWTKTLRKLGKNHGGGKLRKKARRDCRLEALEPRTMLTSNFENPWAVASNSLESPVATTFGGGIVTVNSPDKPAYFTQANARPIIEFSYELPSGITFDSIEATVVLAGQNEGTVVYNDATGDAKFGFQVDATDLQSGRYDWSVTLVYKDGTTTVQTDDPVTGEIDVINRLNDPTGNSWNSEFGSGWNLPELDRLVIQNGLSDRPDGALLVTGDNLGVWFDDPNGSETTFNPAVGPYNFSTLTKQLNDPGESDDTYTLLDPDGTKHIFDYQGLLQTVVDRNGNDVRTYAYANKDGDAYVDELVSITDHVNRVTTFNYAGGSEVVTSMEDFAGEETFFAYYSDDSLKSITDPDPDETDPLSSPVTRYEYTDGTETGSPPQGLLKTLIDPRAQRTTIAYDYLGLVEQITERWGGVVDIESVWSQIRRRHRPIANRTYRLCYKGMAHCLRARNAHRSRCVRQYHRACRRSGEHLDVHLRSFHGSARVDSAARRRWIQHRRFDDRVCLQQHHRQSDADHASRRPGGILRLRHIQPA